MKEWKSYPEYMTAISHFINLWRTPNKEKLFSLISGAPVAADVEVNVLRAEGGLHTESSWLQINKVFFFDMLKQQKLWSMEGNNKKVSLLKSQGEFNPLSAAKQKTPLDLDTLMGYSSLLVPLLGESRWVLC